MSSWFSSTKDKIHPKKKEVEQLLQTKPSFPGVTLHVCTEDVSLSDLDDVKVPFPVHIRNTSLFKQNLAEGIVPQPKNNEINPPLKLKYTYGNYEVQGKREYMEDRTKIIENLVDQDKNEIISYFGIFDGHAGKRVAEICQSQLHTIIQQQDNLLDENLDKLLFTSIKEQDKIIIEKATKDHWKDGSCVSIVLLHNKHLFSANLGDSHMILAHRDRLNGNVTPIRISETHKASEEFERKRIIDNGGMVLRGRVFGDLSISRAFGDIEYKIPTQESDFISSDAFTCSIELIKEHLFIIIASDGLWDKVTFKEAIDIVYPIRLTKTPDEISCILVEEASKRGSGDNISVIVILLDWEIIESKNELSENDNNDE